MFHEPRVTSRHLTILVRLLVIILSVCQQNWGQVRDVGKAISLPLTHVFRTLVPRVSVEVGKASFARVLQGVPTGDCSGESRGSVGGAEPRTGA